MAPPDRSLIRRQAHRLHPLLGPARHLGRRLYVRQVERSLRFKDADRFGHEFPDRRRFFRHAFHYLVFNGIGGDYAEFGSFGGYTFRLAWSAARLVGYDCQMWAFDSFSGLPGGADARDEHPRWTEGTMATPVADFHALCRKWGIPAGRYHVVPGFYSETLPEPGSSPRPERIAFAHVDCDLYSSTIDVLRFVESRLGPGSVVAFDDYYCYSPDQPSGERLAVLEHLRDSRWSLVPYIQYGWAGMSFVVEHRRPDGATGVHW